MEPSERNFSYIITGFQSMLRSHERSML